MGYGFKVGGSLQFKATINVQANANVTVTISLNGTQVASAKTGTNGVASFLVKKKGTYTVAHSGVISQTVSVTQYKGTYSVNVVYVTPANNLTAGGYQTGSAYVVWNNEPNFRTGSVVRYSTSSYPTSYNSGSAVFGVGSTAVGIAITNTSTRYGFRQSIASGQTLYWTRFNYVTVNGVTYYSAYNASARAAYTYVNYAGKATILNSGTWTVPTGVRSVVMYAVGGGGSGSTSGEHYKTYMFEGGGAGGGGGYTRQSGTVSVTPGMVASVTVGQGGAAVSGAYVNGLRGGTTSVTLNNYTISAEGGYGGGAGKVEDTSYGGNGGSGGGAGGFYRSGSVISYSPGAGGTNGGNGSKNSGGYGYGGTGQGTSTTFDGVTYASGGSGGGNGAAGTDGLGNGGEGAWADMTSGKGGNGVVLIKY